MTTDCREPDLSKIKWPEELATPERLYMLRALWKSNNQIDENAPLDSLEKAYINLPGAYVNGMVVFNTKELLQATDDILRFGLVAINVMDYYRFQDYLDDHGRLSKREFDAQQKAAGAGQAIGWRIEVQDGAGGDSKAQHWFVTAGKDGARSLCGQVYGYMNRFGAYGGDHPVYCKTCVKLQAASR